MVERMIEAGRAVCSTRKSKVAQVDEDVKKLDD